MTQKPLSTNSWLNLETQIANTSKIPLLGGSFCKFKGVLKISPGKDPDFRVQQPKKHIVGQISYWPVQIHPKPRFDWSSRESY